MLKPGDIAIVSGARTPFGRYCGKIKDYTAQELGAVAAKAAIERAGVDAEHFDHAVFGNAQQTSGDALYGARHVGLRAGLPIETPALTVNRLCGSGMQAIVSAAQMIQTEEAKVVLAGGMESMSQAPFSIRGRDGFTLAPGGKLEDQVFAGRKYYSMALNMPNFTSYGGSWIMRFAELNPTPGTVEGVSAPVAVSKVDPAYPAALIRDKVEGTVILRAVIHSDGSVGDIHVLQSLNETLDGNAEAALQKWHFRPGTKNGAPVDLEAVIKIPFRAPKTVF